MNRINPVSLMMNWMNLVSLVDQIVCLYQIYNENKQGMHSVRNFVHKIENIIIHMSEI